MNKVPHNKQFEILNYIWDKVSEHGYPPTVREIGEAVHLSSTSTVHGHLSRLEKRGLILKDPAKPRALEVTEAGLEFLGISKDTDKIPMLGTVTAGEPILAVEEATSFFPLPPNLANEESGLFMLQIRGTSMINCGILNGDYVIVKKQSTANNGEIVIALTDENEATCKRFFKEDDYYRLQPENDAFEPIILNNVSILGKVIGLYRKNIK
ncbi:transcriptional repressor LexA [Lentilactobacillus laojiaonis]|uniref:transcriptional repressor LexA n=1 Tax=Lentilactobacillus laojiaonis TaxID=2883998 RepID=UPI001D0A3419|nr:transcriptional repressor LexA [Lentilactobacillus laojiaonis]UDM31671.1 transcriptional repressor LexA [Lentilactobacillus laojiaonis]